MATVEQSRDRPSSTDTGGRHAQPRCSGDCGPARSRAKPRRGEKGRHAGPNLMLFKTPRADSQGEADRMCCLEGLGVHRPPGLWPPLPMVEENGPKAGREPPAPSTVPAPCPRLASQGAQVSLLDRAGLMRGLRSLSAPPG